MGGRDDAFRQSARAEAAHEGRFAREIERTKQAPDEVLELHNFACGAALIAGDEGRQAIQFILPTGRQVIAKMKHETALALARSIELNVELYEGGQEASENGLEPSGS